MHAASALGVQGTINDAFAELTVLGHLDNHGIIFGEGEMLAVDFLSAVDERYLGHLDAEVASHIGHILHHLDALSLVGVGDNGCIGENQQLVIVGNVGHGSMGQHVTLGQNAGFLVQDGTQQVVGVDQTLHQHVGLVLTHQSDSLSGSVIGISSVNITDVGGKGLQGLIGTELFFTAHEDGFNKTCLKSLSAGSGSFLIGSPNDSHTFLHIVLFEMSDQLIEILNGIH